MYRPSAFDVAEVAELHELIRGIGVAHVVTAVPDGFDASFVPLLLEPLGHLGVLVGHLARPNPQWQACGPNAPALAIFTGPDAYVSPSYYPSKAEHGRVVPTWNYVTVHAHGELLVHDDPGWTMALVRRLTDHHESTRPDPWSVDDAPEPFIDAQIRNVVGIELRITRLEGKRKLSQNRPEADIAGVTDAFARGTLGERRVAEGMKR